jgi:GxxExxY protein
MEPQQKTTETKIHQKTNFFYGEISYKINGILIEVFKELGKFSREKQYGDLIEKKLKEKNMRYEREVRIGDSGNIVDFIIEDKIILELKTVPFLIKEHFNQVKRYLHQSGLKLGIIVNFRTDFLSPKHVLNENC